MSEVLLYPYCTLQEAQDFMEDSTLGHVDRFIRGINGASRYADSITGKFFYRLSYVAAPVLSAMAGDGNWRVFPSAVYTQPAYIQAPYGLPIIPGTITFTTAGITLAEGTDYSVDYLNGQIFLNVANGRSGGGWLPNITLITADVGYDNGTSPYDSTVPAPAAPGGLPGSVRFNIPRLIPFFTGLWRKAIMADGSAAFVNMGQGKLPQDILDLWEKIRQGRKP
jgi:hypothetical protein